MTNWRSIEGGEQTIIGDFLVRVLTNGANYGAWRVEIKSRGTRLKFFDTSTVTGLDDKRIAKFVAEALLHKLKDFARATKS